MKVSKLGRYAVPLISASMLVHMAACGAKRSTNDDINIEYQGERKVEPSQTMVKEEPSANKQLTDGSNAVTVLGGAEVLRMKASGKISRNFEALEEKITDVSTTDVPGEGEAVVSEQSMYVAYPIRLLGQGNLFGGVITTVSDRASETLGRLKLTDLPAIHSRLFLDRDEKENYSVVLVGCFNSCTEASQQAAYLSLPVVGVTDDNESLVLDLSKFGNDFNLLDIVDPDGDYTGLKTIETKTTGIDFSTATMVWDVQHTMIPKEAEASDTSVPRTLVGVRFYLKLESGMNSAFASRKPVPGVGFFGTTWAADELITRFTTTSFDGRPAVHYYIKNVPAAEKPHFAAAFDHWNATFTEIIGKDLISYQFVEEGSPESEQLITGDPRYNIVEWDLVNDAPYGGLGPSMASQTTGEIFSGNVLVQGPNILKIYKEWFGVADEVKKLQADGKAEEADALFLESRRKMLAQISKNEQVKIGKVSLGKVSFRTHGDSLADPLATRQDFFALPDGESYESYMKGYWKELVGHEIGHNLGLRHNFRGNLFGKDDKSGISVSIMEYQNREFRHKSAIGIYDAMALAYGYAGKLPARTDMFCTDEHVFSESEPDNSAECSRDDATDDSFKYLSSVAQRALNYLVARGSSSAPTWTIEDLKNELNYSLSGMLSYAASADATSKTWVNWAKGDRPTEPAAIKAYVLAAVKSQLCHVGIRKAVEQKRTQEAKEATLKNLADLDAKVAELSKNLKIGDSALFCN